MPKHDETIERQVDVAIAGMGGDPANEELRERLRNVTKQRRHQLAAKGRPGQVWRDTIAGFYYNTLVCGHGIDSDLTVRDDIALAVDRLNDAFPDMPTKPSQAVFYTIARIPGLPRPAIVSIVAPRIQSAARDRRNCLSQMLRANRIRKDEYGGLHVVRPPSEKEE